MGIKNKRGVFFTTLTVLILTLFLAVYLIDTKTTDRGTINKRVATMDSFIFSLEEDLHRSLYVSGFRIVFIWEKEIIESGSYISNLNSTGDELFFNGTFNGNSEELMLGATLSEIHNKSREKADNLNIDLDLYNPSLTISQSDPWHVRFTLIANSTIEDKTNLASWNKTFVIVEYIPINRFEDPLYIINTNGKVARRINQTSYQPFVEGSSSSKLLSHLQAGMYVNSTEAPSFLSRLQGITAADQQGIESFVSLPQLAAQNIPISNKSVVDHIYFSNLNPSTSAVSGMPAWFRIDEGHVDLYNARSLTSF